MKWHFKWSVFFGRFWQASRHEYSILRPITRGRDRLYLNLYRNDGFPNTVELRDDDPRFFGWA